jgi:predicted transcriptional regulator
MARKPGPQRPTVQVNLRLDPAIAARLDDHVRNSRMSRAALVEGALVRLFDAVDREAHRSIVDGVK